MAASGPSWPSWSRKPTELLGQDALERLHNCRKRILGGFHWGRKNKAGTRWSGKVRVGLDDDPEIGVEVHLELEVTWVVGDKFTFRLYVIETNQPIRMYHNRPGHSDNPHSRIDGAHKHTNADRLMRAYGVSSTEVDPTELNAALHGFLEEEAIFGSEGIPSLEPKLLRQRHMYDYPGDGL